MSRLPIRTRAPIGVGSPAPRTGGGTMLMQLAEWSPTKLKATGATLPLPKGGTVRYPMSTYLPKLRVPHPGWILAGFVAEIVLKEIYTHAMLYLNGLAFSKFCRLVGSDGFGTAPPSSTQPCLTGQGSPIYAMGEIPRIVPGMNPGAYINVMGQSGRAPATGFPRYSSQSYYRVIGAPVGVTRPRPFYAPTRRYFEATVPVAQARFARPGQVPAHVRPWPVWAGPRPWVDPAPTPDAAGVPKARGTVPPWSWAWPGRGLPISRPLPGNPAIPRNPPIGRTREVKFGANTAVGRLFFAIMRAREAVSEFQDFVQVIFRALPKDIQKLYGGNKASVGDMMTAVFEHAGEIDGGLFIRNLIANQIEDEIIGRTYFKLRGELRNIVFGKSMGSLGPVSNPLFEEYAKAVSAFAEAIAKALTGGQDLSHDDERSLDAARRRVAAAWDALTR